MLDFKPQYLNQPVDGYSEVEDLDAVLYELESADIKASMLDVSLEFWKRLQMDKHIRLTPNGDIFYKYLKINVNPQQETNFLLY